MKQAELFDLIRADPTVVPFVGAGLAIPTGVPSVGRLAAALANRAKVEAGDLEQVSEAAIAKLGEAETKRIVARIVGARTPIWDPTLNKLGQWPAGRLLTTNYDEAAEVAIRRSGREAVSVSYADTEALTPSSGVVKVIHLHGHVKEPDTIILPGRSTDALVDDETFLRQVSAMMEPGPVLYLGFSFAKSEVHLRGIVRWVRRLKNAREQLLVLPETELAGRGADLAELEAVPQVDVTTYEADRGHTFVGKIAALHAFRPDATGANVEGLNTPRPEIYVGPALVMQGDEDGVEDLQGKVWGAEQGWSEPFVDPTDLVDEGRALVIASPGMGKTEMLNHLSRNVPEYESIVLSSRFLAAELAKGDDDESWRLRAVASAIANGRAGREGTPRPDWDALDESAFLFLLDDFDQGGKAGREAVARALLDAGQRWPNHRWIVAGRPCEEGEILRGGGFESYRILPSEMWGVLYLEVRGIAKERVEWLISEQTGFGTVIGIPLFAAEAANRLLDNEEMPATPLGLILDAQRRAIRSEAAKRHGRSGVVLDAWLRRLAVGLELRGRIEASVEELAAVPGHGDLDGEQVREEMVRASLLIDSAGSAAFTRRTLQEALCAAALLETEDPGASLERVAVAEIAGERELRSDMDFTIDLVFESAEPELRDKLRELDERRWAMTVVVRGSEEDGGEALDLLLADAQRRGHGLSRFAQGLRAPLQAAVAIARAWPGLVEARRDRLIAEIGSTESSRRFNALCTLAAQRQDPDPAWLIALIEDEEAQIRLAAARAAAAWGFKDAVPALRRAVKLGELQFRKRVLWALLDLVDEQEVVVEIAAAIDGQLFGETASRIDERIDIDDYLSLLGKNTNDSRIWEWMLGRVLELGEEEGWNDARVERLVKAVIRHNSDPQLALDPRLTEVVEANLGVALAAARASRFERPPAYRGYAMFSRVPAEHLRGDENAEIREAAERAVSEDELEDWRRPQQLDWRDLLLSRLDDREVGADLVLDPDTRWPIEQMSGEQRQRLLELTEANLPEPGREIKGRRYFRSEEEEIALGALNAAAQLGLPMQRERWMALVRSPGAIEDAGYLVRWLRDTYTADHDGEIASYVDEFEDGRGLSALIACLPRDARRPRDAIRERLDQFTTDVDGWGNAATMLSEPEDAEPLIKLRKGSRTELQAQRLRERLARLGNVEARLEMLDQFIAVAQEGGHLGDPPWWRPPVTDDAQLERLGNLLVALGGGGSKHWDLAAGLLSNSPSDRAVAVIDRVSAELGAEALLLHRRELVRRLAAAAVLNRLPTELAEAAMVLEPDPVRSETGAMPSLLPFGSGCLARLCRLLRIG